MQARDFQANPTPSATLYEFAQRRDHPPVDWDGIFDYLSGLTSREIGQRARYRLDECLRGEGSVLARHWLDLVGFVLCQREGAER